MGLKKVKRRAIGHFPKTAKKTREHFHKDFGRVVHVHESTEEEMNLNILLDKLDRWLVVQPEWVLLMGLPLRARRKDVAHLVARELLTIPVNRPDGYVPNRALRREMMRALKRVGGSA